jgi:hypothetical protein
MGTPERQPRPAFRSRGLRTLPALSCAAAAAFVAVLCVSAWSTLRLAVADHLYRTLEPGALDRAARLTPGDARIHMALAATGEARARRQALERALAANPRSSRARLELALVDEFEGRPERAEEQLAEAARLDRTFEPRWSLAGFYFRRHATENFWRWAGAAAQIAPGEATALYRLAWEMSGDADAIWRRVVPPAAQTRAAYVLFLLSRRKLDAAGRAAAELASQDAAASREALLEACDQLIAAGMPAPALEIWNRMARSGAVPGGVLDPVRGAVLTDAAFEVAPGRGFGWRIWPFAGVSTSRAAPERGLRFSFSGSQPDGELMSQTAPLVAGKTYRFEIECRAEDIPEASGLVWRLPGGVADVPVGQEWRRLSAGFTAPESGLGRLSLAYRRKAGSTRIEGSLFVRAARLEPVEEP